MGLKRGLTMTMMMRKRSAELTMKTYLLDLDNSCVKVCKGVVVCVCGSVCVW